MADVYVDDIACIASLEAFAASAPASCAAGVNIALEEAEGMAKDDIKVDTGAAKSLIDIVPATPTAIFDAQLRSMAQYSTAIEAVPANPFARAPGSTPPPVAALLGWASRHNSTSYTNKQFAYVVARTIGEKGVESKQYIAYLAQEKLPAMLMLQIELALSELIGL
jgi:hypothetical protein